MSNEEKELLDDIKKMVLEDPCLVIKIEHLCKELKTGFRAQKVYYGNGGYRGAKHQNQTETDMMDSVEMRSLKGRHVSYGEFTMAYKKYCASHNIPYDTKTAIDLLAKHNDTYHVVHTEVNDERNEP